MYSYYFSYDVSLNSATFFATASKPSGWFHVVINYMGPDEGEGIRIYHDGVQVANATTKSTNTCQHVACRPDGTILVGRLKTRQESNYCSLQVDELAFFNEALSEEEIRIMLSQQFNTIKRSPGGWTGPMPSVYKSFDI